MCARECVSVCVCVRGEMERGTGISQHIETFFLGVTAPLQGSKSVCLLGDATGGVHLTFVHAREAVLQNGQLVDFAELLEERPEVLLVQVARYLADEQFDGIVILHGNGGAARGTVVAYSVHEPVCAGSSGVN